MWPQLDRRSGIPRQVHADRRSSLLDLEREPSGGVDLADWQTVREIAQIALVHATGTRGLRSVIEEVLEVVLFDDEAGVRYVITDGTVRGGDAVRQSIGPSRDR